MAPPFNHIKVTRRIFAEMSQVCKQMAPLFNQSVFRLFEFEALSLKSASRWHPSSTDFMPNTVDLSTLVSSLQADRTLLQRQTVCIGHCYISGLKSASRWHPSSTPPR